MRVRRALAMAFLFALCGGHWAAAQSAAASGTHATLRVGVWTLWHDKVVSVAPVAAGRAELRSCETCKPNFLTSQIAIAADGDHLVVTDGGRVQTNARLWLHGAVKLSAHNETITLANIVTIAAHGGVLLLAATLPVEDYVQRVVASESGSADSTESLKALAIVVRTFALHVKHGHAEYDLCDSTHCQLLHWGGNPERQAAAHAATLHTAGETLWFRGQRARAYFSKDCGGHTASAAEVWPGAQAVPYLTSQPDMHGENSGGAWATELSRGELSTALEAAGLARPGWQSLTVARRGPSGRAVTLRLAGSGFAEKETSAEDFRLAVGQSLGWNRLPSTWFEVNMQGDRFQFHGRGVGHGVGLCQRGAAALAAQGGQSAEQILAHYFPGANPADEATGQIWKHFEVEGFRLESLDAADAAFLPEIARARSDASQRSGLNAAGRITVRAFATTTAFRDATLAPGWVAAFTEGSWIGSQPLRTLAARKLLEPTLRHEFLHALVEQQAGPRTPLWLREGLVEAWSDAETARGAAPAMSVDATEQGLVHAGSEVQSQAAHRAAGWYAAKLLADRGHEQVMVWLRSGVPAGVVPSP